MTGASHEKMEIHGGSVTMTSQYHFETVFTAGDVRLYAYDGKQNPLPAPKVVRASVTLERHPGKPTRLNLVFKEANPAQGRGQGYFTAAADFAGADSMQAVFRVEGLSKAPVEFRTPVTVVERTVYACPMHPEVKGDDPLKCPKCGMMLERVSKKHDAGPKH